MVKGAKQPQEVNLTAPSVLQLSLSASCCFQKPFTGTPYPQHQSEMSHEGKVQPAC